MDCLNITPYNIMRSSPIKLDFICYLQYLFQPVDPPQFSSHNNQGILNLYIFYYLYFIKKILMFELIFFCLGICVKVIEYVLEIEKRRLTDQASENTQGANFSNETPNFYGNK